MCQVKRRSFLGLSATIVGGGLIAGKTGYGFVSGSQDAPGSVHHHVHAVSVMTETANRFLAALSPKQRAKASFQFSDAPGERAVGGRAEPDRLHQGRHHHEPGRRAEGAGER